MKIKFAGEYGMINIHDLSAGQYKNFEYISDCGKKLLQEKSHFLLFYAFFKKIKIKKHCTMNKIYKL